MKKILSFITFHALLTQAASQSSNIKYGITEDIKPRVKLKDIHPIGESYLQFRYLIKTNTAAEEVAKIDQTALHNMVAF